jgi:hypothetical protein
VVVHVAVAASVLAAAALPFPEWGKYVAIGLAIVAIATGLAGFRRGTTGPKRLWAAGGAALGAVCLLLGLAKVVLTLAALGHLREVLR